MATTLPSLTRQIDDDFVNTWYEIRADVIDNILESTVFWLALKEFGCLKTQVGGEFITRTVGYGEKSMQNIQKGSVLSQNEAPADTMGIWDWRYFAVDVNRSLVDDQKNAGKFRIKSYIARRLEMARNALVQDTEQQLFQYSAYANAPVNMNGLYDIVAPYTAAAAGTRGAANASDTYATNSSNGKISRTNTWWRNWVGSSALGSDTVADKKIGLNAGFSINLVPDMRHAFNLIKNQQEKPNFILCSQDLYETYEDEVADKQQIVRSAFDMKAVDLGFETLTFKGSTMTYSSNLEATGNNPSIGNEMFMLNMSWIEFVYDPTVWFDMTEWKSTSNQLERVAYIVSACTGLITEQPRRHGYLYWAS